VYQVPGEGSGLTVPAFAGDRVDEAHRRLVAPTSCVGPSGPAGRRVSVTDLRLDQFLRCSRLGMHQALTSVPGVELSGTLRPILREIALLR
jgi:hypothetical protein